MPRSAIGTLAPKKERKIAKAHRVLFSKPKNDVPFVEYSNIRVENIRVRQCFLAFSPTTLVCIIFLCLTVFLSESP